MGKQSGSHHLRDLGGIIYILYIYLHELLIGKTWENNRKHYIRLSLSLALCGLRSNAASWRRPYGGLCPRDKFLDLHACMWMWMCEPILVHLFTTFCTHTVSYTVTRIYASMHAARLGPQINACKHICKHNLQTASCSTRPGPLLRSALAKHMHPNSDHTFSNKFHSKSVPGKFIQILRELLRLPPFL